MVAGGLHLNRRDPDSGFQFQIMPPVPHGMLQVKALYLNYHNLPGKDHIFKVLRNDKVCPTCGSVLFDSWSSRWPSYVQQPPVA